MHLETRNELAILVSCKCLRPATARGMSIAFTEDECILDRTGKSFIKGAKREKLIYISTNAIGDCHVATGEVGLRNSRFGLISHEGVSKMIIRGRINGASAEAKSMCKMCATVEQVMGFWDLF